MFRLSRARLHPLRAVAIPALLALGPVAPVSAEARPERAVIRLSCPPAGQALCPALRAALAEAAPGRVIRPVPPGAERPSHPGDLGVALVRVGAAWRLDWQGADGAVRHGPALTARRADFAKPSPQNFANSFARKLVQGCCGLRDSLPAVPEP